MLATLESGGKLPKHSHGRSEVTIYVISGKGEIEMDEECYIGMSDDRFFVSGWARRLR